MSASMFIFMNILKSWRNLYVLFLSPSYGLGGVPSSRFVFFVIIVFVIGIERKWVIPCATRTLWVPSSSSLCL
jgi:hypothetical protein